MGCGTVLILAVLILTMTVTVEGKMPNANKKTRLTGSLATTEGIRLDLSEGSGGDDINNNDEDGEYGSGDDGVPTMTACYQKQMAARASKEQNVYVPQCTKNGQFSSRQCHTAQNSCWCVDSNGREIPNTFSRDLKKINCPKVQDSVQKTSHRVTSSKLPKGYQPTARPTTFIQKGDDGFILDPKSKFNNGGHEASVDIEISSRDNDFDSKGSAVESKHSPNSVFSKPGVLAVIVGGAVVGLLFSVTLIMFIVYRMRKKDEGSYALDEPKASPTVGYTKTRDREFFA